MIVKLKLCIATILSALFAAALIQPVSAQTPKIGLSIVPAINERVVAAGQLAVTTIRVTNLAKEPQAVTLEFRPLAPIDPVIDGQARVRYDASSWLSAEFTEFLLAPEESQEIDIRIEPPSDAGPGGHYASLVFKAINDPEPESEVSSTHITPEVISLLMLTVPGNIFELIEAEFHSPSWFSQGRHRNFTIDLTNLGNVHILPTVNLSLRTTGGDEAAQFTLPPKLSIPGTATTLRQAWSDPPPGIYKARYQITYGSPQKAVTAESGWFVVLPALWIQLVVLGGLALGLRAGLPPLFRRFMKKRTKFSTDITGEPNITIERQKIEDVERMGRLKDKSRRN